MKICHEQLDNDHFLDIILTKEDIEKIMDNILVTGTVRIFSKILYVGIGLTFDMEEEEDAISEIEE